MNLLKQNPFTVLRSQIDRLASVSELPAWVSYPMQHVQNWVAVSEERYKWALTEILMERIQQVEGIIRAAGVNVVMFKRDGTVVVSGQDQHGGAFNCSQQGLVSAIQNASVLQTRDVSSMPPPPPPWSEVSAGGMDLSGPPAPANQQAAKMPEPDPAA